MGREPSSLRSPLFFPLFGALKRDPSNNSKGQCALALGGRCFNNTHNNQRKDGFHITVNVGEDALPGRSVWGNVCEIIGDLVHYLVP